LVLACAAASIAQPCQTWIDRTVSASSPSPRARHAMAYDSTRGVAVLFGGSLNPFMLPQTNLGDTWEWNGTLWLLQAPATAPPAGFGGAMVYDGARHVSVLFTGVDTWEWNGTNWTHRSPVNSPTGRSSHAMCFDSARGVTVLFGGTSGSTVLADTWEW